MACRRGEAVKAANAQTYGITEQYEGHERRRRVEKTSGMPRRASVERRCRT